MNKARMTIRLHNEPPIQEPIHELTQEAVQELEREVMKELPLEVIPLHIRDEVYREPRNSDFVMEHDNSISLYDGEPQGGYYRSRSPGTPFWKLAGSITAAVLTGLLFGSVVIRMFGGDESPVTIPQTGTPSRILEKASLGAAEGQGDLSVPVEAGVTAVVNIPEKTFYMLQYGVFSTGEGASQAEAELEQAGLAAFGDLAGEHRVYAGVSPDREQAKLLSSQLKGEGIELYVREVLFPGAQSAVFANEAVALDLFFETGGSLAAELSTLSASMLGKNTGETVDPEMMKKMTDLHLQWTEALKLLNSGLGPQSEEELKHMEQSMNSAVTALAEYNKNRSKGHLWEVQSGMMNYIMGQKNLIQSL
ncbi:SPOR domain-containing protein [Paenibacillus lemnae]|uniref:SPOR domain-containing protein n=2 Tax=Paenibacillus lemnae TaxID=1330551 RepID=A0A848M6T6_PAELE|nr:SPOR domain-containing protein [Paenibacillus lemnae]